MTSTNTPASPPISGQAAGGRRHFPELDGFRALSILAVLAAHMAPLGPAGWRLNETAGFMGMSVFFILSGFLITKFLWERPDIPAFLLRRVARIVPVVFVASVIFCLVVDQRPDAFFAINLYYFNYMPGAMAVTLSPLWSVAMEMQFYAAIALAVWLLRRRAFVLIPILAVLVTGGRIINGEFGEIQTHSRIDEILAGCFLALIWLNRETALAARAGQGMRLAFYPVLALWALSCWPEIGPLGYARPYLAMALVGAVLFGPETTWQHRFLSTKVMAYIAAISFALYVWHSPFRFGWFAGGSDWERYLVRRPLGLAAVWAIAHLSTFYFEKRFTDWARRVTGPKRGASQEAT